jgi:hypothetical protein
MSRWRESMARSGSGGSPTSSRRRFSGGLSNGWNQGRQAATWTAAWGRSNRSAATQPANSMSSRTTTAGSHSRQAASRSGRRPAAHAPAKRFGKAQAGTLRPEHRLLLPSCLCLLGRLVGASGEAAEAEGGDGGARVRGRRKRRLVAGGAQRLGERDERVPVAGAGVGREQHAHHHPQRSVARPR